MEERNFKTLMYMDKYVDANSLYTGIYWRTVPNLYPIDDTIETLIERGMAIKDMDGNSLITEEYIENLKQCQLVPIVIRSQEEDQDRAMLISEIRTAFADYRASEGRYGNNEAHHEANLTLAKLLGVEMYKDMSGVNWAQYKSKPIES